VVLRDEFTHRGHELVGDFDHRVIRMLEHGLILGDGLLFRLGLVVLRHPLDAGVIPTGRQLLLPGEYSALGHSWDDAVLGFQPIESGETHRTPHVVIHGAIAAAVLDRLGA
jgi:hypothetical protein